MSSLFRSAFDCCVLYSIFSSPLNRFTYVNYSMSLYIVGFFVSSVFPVFFDRVSGVLFSSSEFLVYQSFLCSSSYFESVILGSWVLYVSGCSF